jgi:Amt family ammonium transporter
MKKFMSIALSLIGLSMPALAQEAEAAAPIIDSGNTAWLLLSTALVMLMTPGLAFFYAGMVSRKNVVSTLLQNFVAIALVGLIWIVVGYSLVFTEGNWFIGGFSAVMLDGLTSQVYVGANVPMYAFVAFQMMFAIITPALLTGAFAERVNFKAWLFIMSLWILAVYVPVAHWVWGPGGWIAKDGGLDFAGGLVVHITSGCSALVAAILFGKRYKDGHSTPNDVPMIMLGAALLWFGWFGFNAGSALTSGALASHAFMLTFVGGAAAFLSWMAVDWIRSGKPSAVGSATGIVAGLVCITPAAGYVTIESAIIMCVIAGVICNYVASYVKKISHLDDALDVFACHGVGGIIGAIATGIYASKAVNPAIVTEGLAVSGETSLFFANIAAVFVVAAYSIATTYIIVKLVSVFVPISVSKAQQEAGLDDSVHGEYAKYNETPKIRRKVKK